MPIPRAFAALSRTLTRSQLSLGCVIFMDTVAVKTRVIFTRRSEPMDADRQVFAMSEPAIAFEIASLPRKPKRDDIIVFADAETWKIRESDPTDYGAGMLEYIVSQVSP